MRTWQHHQQLISSTTRLQCGRCVWGRWDIPSLFGWAAPKPAAVDDAPVAGRVEAALIAARQMAQAGNAQLAALRSDRRAAAVSRGAVASWAWMGAVVEPGTRAPRVAAS